MNVEKKPRTFAEHINFGVLLMTDLIPFNDWSKERIKQGRKTCTSRHKKYSKDPRVKTISTRLPWAFIKRNYWKQEGADSPEELQEVIDKIYNRKILPRELFYVHTGDFSK